MGRINLPRVFAGGIVAGGLSVGFELLGIVLGAYRRLGEAIGLPLDHLSVAGLVTMAAVQIVVGGPAAIWFYAAIRPRFGAGPRTAMIAALWIWLILGPYEQTVLTAFGVVKPWPLGALFAVDAVALPLIVVAVLLGAALYKEEGVAASAAS